MASCSVRAVDTSSLQGVCLPQILVVQTGLSGELLNAILAAFVEIP